MDAWFFIVNPKAGNGKASRVWPWFANHLRAHGLELEFVYTESPERVSHCVSEALHKGFRKIAAVGGDGTNFMVINGLMQQKHVSLTEIQYTLFPIGTGNDWARQHRIPRKWKSWLAMVRRNNSIQHNIGEIEFYREGNPETVFFANVAGLAYDGYIGFVSTRYKRFLSSRFFYLALVFWGLFRYRLSEAEVHYDNSVLRGKFYTINAGICRYSGGGMQLTPHAHPTAGNLALTLAGNLHKIGVLLNTWRFYNGRIGGHPKVSLFHVESVTVKSLESAPIHVEADGEYLGITPVKIGLSDKKLNVLQGR